MRALAPFPTPKWPSVNPIGYEQNYIYEGSENIEPFLQFPPQSPSFTQPSLDSRWVKKLNHNASERDRRMKVNSLYSSLRSLLPAAYQTKKLSFPATVSLALKYIPELQEQVERLVLKKEELLLRISQQGGIKGSTEEELGKSRIGRSLSRSAVSINRLSTESELAVQISMHKHKVQETQLSEILRLLEDEGLLQLNATSFQSVAGIVFYNIHLQVESETTRKIMESDQSLCEKLLALCDNNNNNNREGLLLYN